jgi:hypothetical protein
MIDAAGAVGLVRARRLPVTGCLRLSPLAPETSRTDDGCDEQNGDEGLDDGEVQGITRNEQRGDGARSDKENTKDRAHGEVSG